MPNSLRDLLKPHGLCNDIIGIIAKYIEMDNYNFSNHGNICIYTSVDGIMFKTDDKESKISLDNEYNEKNDTCAGYYYFQELTDIDTNLLNEYKNREITFAQLYQLCFNEEYHNNYLKTIIPNLGLKRVVHCNIIEDYTLTKFNDNVKNNEHAITWVYIKKLIDGNYALIRLCMAFQGFCFVYISDSLDNLIKYFITEKDIECGFKIIEPDFVY